MGVPPRRGPRSTQTAPSDHAAPASHQLGATLRNARRRLQLRVHRRPNAAMPSVWNAHGAGMVQLKVHAVKCSTGERETLALVKACKQWRTFLMANSKFTVPLHTDHKPAGALRQIRGHQLQAVALDQRSRPMPVRRQVRVWKIQRAARLPQQGGKRNRQRDGSHQRHRHRHRHPQSCRLGQWPPTRLVTDWHDFPPPPPLPSPRSSKSAASGTVF